MSLKILNLIKFYSIKDFACKNFYAWENGDDFIWLKEEWEKFEQYIETEANAKAFISCLSEIYDLFSHASYFANNGNEYELSNPIHKYMDRTIEILLKVFERPEDVYREFATIKMDWMLPHPDGRKFIYELMEEKWQEKINNFC